MFVLTAEQLEAMPELAKLLPTGARCDSFANPGKPGPLMAMDEDHEYLLHEDGRIVTSQGQQIRPRMAA